jgi:hypothetical protein
MLGINISPLEITHVSAHGFWLWVDEQEFFCLSKNFRGSKPPILRN